MSIIEFLLGISSLILLTSAIVMFGVRAIFWGAGAVDYLFSDRTEDTLNTIGAIAAFVMMVFIAVMAVTHVFRVLLMYI